MAVYRIYLVHENGRLQPAESFYCTSDRDAVERLHSPRTAGVRAELWQGGRFIGVAGTLRRQAGEQPSPAP